jgi:D-aminopeptidase
MTGSAGMTAPAVDAARLDGLIDLPADGPGVAAAVVSPGGTLWSGTAGLASLAQGTAVRSDTRFHLVSLSKPFTAAALAAAAAEGRLSLDDDIRRHLPEMAPPDHGQAVTVRHLLSMTSGLDDMLEIDRLRGVWHPAPGRAPDLLARALVRARTSAPPGRRYMYCNVNFVLADEILRRLGHASADAARRAAVYDPLGLARTTDRHHDGIPLAGMAEPYVLDEGRWRRATDILGICGDPVVSTLDDLARWATALLAGRVPALATMAEPTPLASGRPLRYGLGLFLRQWRGRRAIGHFGTQPGWKAGMLLLPESGIGVVFLSNREDRLPGQMIPRILDTVLPTAEPAVRAPAVVPGEYVEAARGEWVRLSADGLLETRSGDERLSPSG